MPLVEYDNSDSSEYEDEENENELKRKVETSIDGSSNTTSQLQTSKESVQEGLSLFNLLPSSKKPTVIEEDDEFLHKKETAPNIAKPKAKITVPSLSDFNDVEDRPMARPKASNGKKSGLLSMLPLPKNAAKSSTSLIPNALKKKSTPLVPTSVKKNTSLPSPMKKAKIESKNSVDFSDESDNDEEGTTDFFSINKPIDIAPIDDGPLDIDMPVQTPAKPEKRGIESYFKKVPQLEESQPDNEESSDNASESQDSTSCSNSEVMLDDEALRQLVGSRAKRKKEDIQIVDINQQEVLGDNREWLLNSLMNDTTKRVSASKRGGNEPSAQQRRKHQITYLAHQAKANESDLQNQWANNRMTKRKTQSKYGF